MFSTCCARKKKVDIPIPEIVIVPAPSSVTSPSLPLESNSSASPPLVIQPTPATQENSKVQPGENHNDAQKSIDSLEDPFSKASDLLRTWTEHANEFKDLYTMEDEFRAMMGMQAAEKIEKEKEEKGVVQNVGIPKTEKVDVVEEVKGDGNGDVREVDTYGQAQASFGVVVENDGSLEKKTLTEENDSVLMDRKTTTDKKVFHEQIHATIEMRIEDNPTLHKEATIEGKDSNIEQVQATFEERTEDEVSLDRDTTIAEKDLQGQIAEESNIEQVQATEHTENEISLDKETTIGENDLQEQISVKHSLLNTQVENTLKLDKEATCDSQE